MVVRKAIFAALVVGLASAAASAQDFVDSAHLREMGLMRFWQLQLPLESDQVVRDAYLVDDQIYALTNDGYAYAMDSHTGALRWMRLVTRGGYRVPRPCHAGNRTVFVLPPSMVQFDRYAGDELRRLNLRFPAGSPPVSDGELIYFGGIDRRMYAFDVNGNYELWKAGMEGSITSGPVLQGQYLYFASDDGVISACTAANKRFYWQTAVEGSVTADLAADENGVYVASRDQSLYQLNNSFGSKRWRVRFSSPLSEPPVLAGEMAYQYSVADGLVAVATGTVGETEDRIRWKLPDARMLLTVNNTTGYVLSHHQSLLAVDLGSGDVLHEISAPGFAIGLPAVSQGAAYLVNSDGRILCARPLGAQPVNQEMIRQALTRMAPGGATMTPATTAPAAIEAPLAGRPAETAPPPSAPPLGGRSKVTRGLGGG